MHLPKLICNSKRAHVPVTSNGLIFANPKMVSLYLLKEVEKAWIMIIIIIYCWSYNAQEYLTIT